MRIRLIKLGTSAIIFIFLLLFVLVLVRPVYSSVAGKLIQVRDALLSSIEEKTALKIKYEKASPSLLQGLKLKNIQVVDSYSDLVLLKINSVSFAYSLPALFTGNIDEFLGDLIIQGISAEYDVNQNKEVLARISDLVGALSNSEKKSTGFNLPLGVKIYNSTISYFDKNFKIKTRLKKITLKSDDLTNLIMAEINGDVNFFPENNQLKMIGDLETDFSILGTISSSLDEFAGQLRIFKLTNGNISAKPLQIVCDYSNKIFNAQILQNTVPLYLNANYNLEENKALVLLEADDFEPFSLIKLKDKKDSLNKFLGTKLSGKYEVSYSGEESKLNYSGKGGISTGKNLGIDTLNANFSFLGNQDFIDVNYLNVRSDFVSADFEGNCNLKTLQPEGSFFLNYFKFKNGNELTLEMYLDHLDKGFMCFIPQINLGEQFFTALQLDIIPQANSVDYEMSVYDYSNQMEGIIGSVGANGSLLLDSSTYLQCNLSLDNFFIGSALKAVSFFLDEKSAESVKGLSNTVSPYIMSSEFFVSTNFSNITFNVPYSVIANTKKDGEMALFSFDGTESSLQVSQFDVLFAGQEINLTLDADYSTGFDNLFFTSNIALNSVPYNLTGTIIDAKRISLSGDYGFSAEIYNSPKDISGSFTMDSFPIAVENLLLALSLNSEFNFSSLTDWNVKINRFEFVDNRSNNKVSPRLTFMGNLNNYGALFDQINFVDATSILTGQGSMLWSFNQDYLTNASVNINLANNISSESLTIECSASNPMNKTFSELNILNDIFLSAQISIKNSPISRFMANQKSPNVLNANITALGPIDNPGITVSVFDTSISLGNSPMKIKLDASLEDGLANIYDSVVEVAGQNISNLKANFDLSTFTGNVVGNLDGNFMQGSYSAPFEIKVSSSADSSSDDFGFTNFKIPESFLISLNIKEFLSKEFGNYNDINVNVVSSPGRFDFFAGKNNAILGSFVDGKILKLETAQDLPIRMSVNGIIENSLLDISVNNFYLDFNKVTDFISFPFFKAISGFAYGNLHIGGFSTDPEFSGDLIAQDLLFSVPNYVNENLFSKQIKIDVEDNAFVINNLVARGKKGYVDATIRFDFDRWSLYEVEVDVNTRGSTLVPGKFIMSIMQFEGNVALDLNIDVILSEGVTVTGSIFGQDVDGILTPFSGNDEEAPVEESFFYTKVDLDMLLGQHGQVFFPNKESPMLKALINPQTKIKVKLDSETDYFDISGDLVFRGGSVIALDRTFYLREGRLVLSTTQGTFDPIITLRAEMRETDSEGDTVKIYLTATNQKLSMFSPTFTSSPPKSETEIMTLLGQIVLPEDTSSFRDLGVSLLAGGLNYVAQSTAVKEVEDRLRDLFKFDIFSLRTNILQNALIVGLNNENNNVTIGNYLDNSSVYIGKYFGNAMYLDALLHFDYNASLVESGRSLTGLSFEPEFGFELDSPFALIRWSLSPNISNMNNFWIPDVSVGFSWKLLF